MAFSIEEIIISNGNDIYLNHPLGCELSWSSVHDVTIDVIIPQFQFKIQTSVDIHHTRIWSCPSIHSSTKHSVRSNMGDHVCAL